MATSGRETRRRRIVERGNDRLALITGRIPNLPSDAGSESESGPEPHHSHTASCPPWISRDHLNPDQSSPVSISGSESSGPLLTNNDRRIEPDEHDDSDGKSRTTPFMRKCESNIETSSAPVLDLDREEQSFPDSTPLNPRFSASEGGHRSKLKSNYHNIFTPNKISSAVAASESIRFNFSLVAAILVIVSYNSHFFKVIIFFRPLLLLLLTNISIVVARLLVEEEAGSQRNKKEASIPTAGMVDQIGKALELGLLLQNVMGALFMDCSIYSITVICGLSVVQKLGW